MKILVVSNKKSKRVSLIPSDVKKLTENKIEVVVLSDVGKCCGFSSAERDKCAAGFSSCGTASCRADR